MAAMGTMFFGPLKGSNKMNLMASVARQPAFGQRLKEPFKYT
jgi:hypothetical protein